MHQEASSSPPSGGRWRTSLCLAQDLDASLHTHRSGPQESRGHLAQRLGGRQLVQVGRIKKNEPSSALNASLKTPM